MTINYSKYEEKRQKEAIKKMFEVLKKKKLPKNFKVSKAELICQR